MYVMCYQLDFYIVKNPGRALLKLDSCLLLNLISRVNNRQVHRLEEIIWSIIWIIFMSLKFNQETSSPILKYYDLHRSTKLQVDSSEEGFGAVLLQEHDGFYLPVAYGARVTNAAERNYVPLERETLAICFGCEYFHQYIYGLKDIIVESDHKPLATLFSKTLKDNPPRIQMFRMRLMKYSITVQYVPGTQMYLSDTLS